MLGYLYYKLYKSYSKKNVGGTPEIVSAIILTCLLSLNIMMINIFLAKVNIIPFLISNSKQAAVIYTLIILLTMLVIFRKSKREIIFKKYSQESQKDNLRGNIFVIIYISLSMIMFFVVCNFKPGYLPSI